MQAIHPDPAVAGPVGVHVRAHAGARHPTVLELAAALLLAAAVVLHIVGLFPHYFGGAGEGSLWSQPDQAALYAIVAAGWALALGIGLSSPARAAASAAFAVGLALTELGFRVVDLGWVFRGSSHGGAGLYLVTAGWAAGAAGAAAAALAAHREIRRAKIGPASAPGAAAFVPVEPSTGGAAVSSAEPAQPIEATSTTLEQAWAPVADSPWSAAAEARPQVESPATGESPTPVGEWPAPAAETSPAPTVPTPAVETSPAPTAPTPAVETSPAPTVPTPAVETSPAPTMPTPAVGDPTAAMAMAATVEPANSETAVLATAAAPFGPGGGTTMLPAVPEQPRRRPAVVPLIVVGLLSLATAGTFLPAWDHYVGVDSSGRTVGTINLGDAFSNPWQVNLGNVLSALAIALIPIGAYLIRSRGLAAAAVSGMLVALSAQFAAAVVQVGQPVPASIAAINPNLAFHLSLTGWFTADILLAYSLFGVVMVLGHIRTVEAHESSDGTVPSTPDARSVASLPWS